MVNIEEKESVKYVIDQYRIEYKLKMHVWNLENISGGVSTVLKSFTLVKA